MANKYLDLEGLKYFYGEIKKQLNNKLDVATFNNRSINGKKLDRDVTLDGSHIIVGGTSTQKANNIAVAIQNLETKIGQAASAGVTSFGDQKGAITLKAAAQTNGAVNLTMVGNELQAAIYGLGTAAFSDTAAFATPTNVTNAIEESKQFTSNEIKKLGSVYNVQGSKTYADLMKLETVKRGDVYNVTDASKFGPAGTNVVYISNTSDAASVFENWDPLAGTTDLSNYYTKNETDGRYAPKIHTHTANQITGGTNNQVLLSNGTTGVWSDNLAGASYGRVKNGGVATITNGVITAVSKATNADHSVDAGKVTHDLIIKTLPVGTVTESTAASVEQRYNGSEAVVIEAISGKELHDLFL